VLHTVSAVADRGQERSVECQDRLDPYLTNAWSPEYAPSWITSCIYPLMVEVNTVLIFIYGAEPFLRSHQLCSYSRTSQHFMEPGCSLPLSQEPCTGLYTEPDQSDPYHPISLRVLEHRGSDGTEVALNQQANIHFFMERECES
jgi:hypothetical protein